MSSTEEILNHHLESFGGGDLEGLLSDYTDDSVLETPMGQMKFSKNSLNWTQN